MSYFCESLIKGQFDPVILSTSEKRLIMDKFAVSSSIDHHHKSFETLKDQVVSSRQCLIKYKEAIAHIFVDLKNSNQDSPKWAVRNNN